jgi:phage terminase large subunit
MADVPDPLRMAKLLWPGVSFYKEQRDIIYSVQENYQTFVPAGNMLGKDFVSAFIALHFFLSRQPVRVVTTSADYAQLESVLWGEIRRFVQTSRYPLSHEKGGPIVTNHLNSKKVLAQGKVGVCGISYLLGRVAAKGEGMLGHHAPGPVPGDGIPRSLFIVDEASGVDDEVFERATTWAERILVIGNPYPCSNFFYKGVEAGDVLERNRL